MRTIGPAGIFLILLGVLAAVPVQAQTPPGICDRTQQVQDGILNRLSGVSDCAEVTTTHLTTVTELTLESVGLTSLRADDFAGLTELKELRLTGNYQLYGLPSGVFSGLAKLETLDLYNNQFHQGLPAGVFSGLTKLETLNLGANRLPTLRAEVFSGLSALETLNLERNRLPALPAGVFSGLSALKTLSLNDNLLPALPAGVFSGLSALETLDLGGNDLTDVPVEVFSDISALKTLILRWNQIGSLPDGAFSDLPNLEKLDLFHNLITALPPRVFSGLTKLKVLMAGSNQLVALPDGVFAGLTMLDILDVAENPVHPLLLSVTVETVGSDRVRAKVPAGAPFALSLPVSVTNGGLAGGASTLEISAGAVVGEAVAVTRTEGTTEAVTVDLGTPLPSPPMGTGPPYPHRGYAFVRAPSGLPVKFVLPAWIRNVRVVSGPGADGVWSAGERVELEVRYNYPVVVEQPSSYYDCWSYNDDGTCKPPGPFLVVGFRSDARPGYGRVLSTPLASYVGGSGTNALVFEYEVGAAEDGARRVEVGDDGMLLRGATIRTLEGGEGASRYTITRVMQVDVRKPGGAAWAAGEKVRVRVRFTGPPQPYTPDTPPEERLNWDKVDVAGGAPTIGLHLGDRERRTQARTASYVGGSGTNALVFEYEVTGGDGRVGAVEVEADSLASNGATIRNERGYDAELDHLGAVQYAQRPALSVADAEATEGEDATLDFVVRLDGNSGSEVKVDYRTRDGTAEAGSDYTETRGGLTFAPGEYEKTVSVPIRDDAVEDDGETFTLLLGNVSGAGVANDDYEAVGTIRNSETTATVAGPADDAPEVDAAAPLTVRFVGMPAAHRGEGGFKFRVAFSEDIGISFRALREDAFMVTGGRVTGGKRVDDRRDLFEMTVRPDSDDDVTITLQAERECAVSGAICTKGENRRKLTNTVSARVRGPAVLSVADARAREGEDETIDFAVSLSRAATATVTVDYKTADGSAKAGKDYTARKGTLTFSPGRTARTVRVRVLDDAHDEGKETLTLRLRNASGAGVADGTATGTIVNSDPLPKGWLARFGRTSATQVVGLLTARFDEAAAPSSQLVLGGRSWRLSDLRGGTHRPAESDRSAHADCARGTGVTGPAADRPATAEVVPAAACRARMTDRAPGGRDVTAVALGAGRDTFSFPASTGLTGTGADLPGAAARSDPAQTDTPPHGAVSAGGKATWLERTAWALLTRGNWQIDKRRFLSRSGFNLDLSGLGNGTDETEVARALPEPGGRWSLWGRGALTHFAGQDAGVSLDGDVLTGLLGVDYARDRWLAGVALSYSDGAGTYSAPARGNSAGTLDSALVSVHPYLHYRVTPRLAAWGALGYGEGALRLRPKRGTAGVGDGLKSVPGVPGESALMETGLQLGMGALGLTGTLYATDTTELALKSDVLWVRTASEATDGLQAVDGADTRRLRLLLTGTHRRSLVNGAELTPSVELGLRYDGGDAETGAGIELGGGLRYADAVRGLTLESRARALLAHEDGGYEEWGLSGSLALDPGRLGRGLALRLDSAWGATDSGTDALWQRRSGAGLVPRHDTTPQGRIRAEWGYGLDVPWTHGLLTPYGSMELSGGSRTTRLGWRFELGRSLSLSLDGERRETAHARPAHGLMLRTALPW